MDSSITVGVIVAFHNAVLQDQRSFDFAAQVLLLPAAAGIEALLSCAAQRGRGMDLIGPVSEKPDPIPVYARIMVMDQALQTCAVGVCDHPLLQGTDPLRDFSNKRDHGLRFFSTAHNPS